MSTTQDQNEETKPTVVLVIGTFACEKQSILLRTKFLLFVVSGIFSLRDL